MVLAAQVMCPQLLDHQSLMVAVSALDILQRVGYLVSRESLVVAVRAVVCITLRLLELLALGVVEAEPEPVVQDLMVDQAW
jgi:hypothetical protein